MSGDDHNPGSELDLDAIEAQARHWDHLIRDDPETTLALVAEVRRLRAQVERVEALADEWKVAEASGGNGRHGYHATEYGDLYAADLRAVLDRP